MTLEPLSVHAGVTGAIRVAEKVPVLALGASVNRAHVPVVCATVAPLPARTASRAPPATATRTGGENAV